jgi:HlyD family secretion protein
MNLKLPKANELLPLARRGAVTLRGWSRVHPRKAVSGGAGLLLLAVLMFRSCGSVDLPDTAYHTVRRSDFLISVIEGGTVKAVHEETVRCEVEGTSRIISIVPEGAYVRQGDLLIELDSSELRERLSQQEVTFENTQFSFVQAKENLAIQKSLGESQLKDSELKVEFAASDLEKYREGDWPQQTNVVNARIKIAAEELSRAKDRLDWTGTLSKKGYATKSELEADQLAVQRKEIEVGQTREELRLLIKYDFPKRVRILESAVEQALKEQERLKARIAAQLAQAEADLNSRQNTLDLQKERQEQLRLQLDLTKIKAPQDGLVIYASTMNQGGGGLIEEGATVRQRQELIKLPDVSQMMIEVRIHESHVQKIRPGLPALVAIDSVPDRQFRAYVRKVAVLPDSSSRFYNPNLKVYTTEVVITEPLPENLKPGVSGRAEIVITNLQGVLTVPIQAATTIKGRQVCLVKRGSSSEPVPVELGLFNDRLIEIKSGLKEGDRVLLSPLSASDNIDLGGALLSDGVETNGRPSYESLPPVAIPEPKPASTNSRPRPEIRYSEPEGGNRNGGGAERRRRNREASPGAGADSGRMP